MDKSGQRHHNIQSMNLFKASLLNVFRTFCLFIIVYQCALGQTVPAENLHGLHFRNIGPANQGGRIVDIEARNDDFAKVFVAVGSGGVWKSENAGTTWKPVFDDYETASIGDIALDPNNPDVLWVGTGEANNRNSVSWGNGVYRSLDGGGSFEHMGLSSTHQIARVLVHPDDSDDVCVCAIGHLWGHTGDRGLFHTEDAGDTWTRMGQGLPDDGKTGCIDVVRNPQNPDVLYAAFYERLRQPWHFHSGGDNGGIFKSTDSGKTWKKLTQGLPNGPTGRIGLAIYEQNPEIIMAIVEAERSESLSVPGSGIYRSENGGESWTFVNLYNNRPFYYSQIRINPHDDQRVYVLTTRFMVSDDGGRTLSNGSEDQEVHGDFHALWLDPTARDRYYLGADKGLSITHDHGRHFILLDNLPIGQFYRINYDMRDPYYVYGGYQDNGMYAVASFSRDARGILNDSNWKLHWGDGQYVAVNPFNWREMYTSMENGSYFDYDPLTHRIERISPNPGNTINFSEYFADAISDMASALRFNWSAPMIMSPHDPSTLYVCGNHIFKSIDKGKSWRIISPDLTTNDPVKRKQGVSGGITPDNSGAETHCSITTFGVSSVTEDILWAGTDDGIVHVSRDGGGTWINRREKIPEVPQDIWVSRIEVSSHQPGRAYITFDGHRSDHFGTWIFVTEDFGQSWEKRTSGISDGEVIRVIREDPVNEDLIFAGTETGVWYSLDQGRNWQRMDNALPTVSVYDLKIHPRDGDLIIGTHGRSIWIMDDITPLQQWRSNTKRADFGLFQQRKATLWENVSRGGQRGHFWYAGENPPTILNTSSLPRAQFDNAAAISYHVQTTLADSLVLVISNMDRTQEHKVKVSPEKGIHRYYWDLEFDAKPYTNEQEEQVQEIFRQMMARSGSSFLSRRYEDFQEADTPDAKRRAVEPLTRGFLSMSIDEDLLMPRAGAGTYRLELIYGEQKHIETLEIRVDPLVSNR